MSNPQSHIPGLIRSRPGSKFKATTPSMILSASRMIERRNPYSLRYFKRHVARAVTRHVLNMAFSIATGIFWVHGAYVLYCLCVTVNILILAWVIHDFRHYNDAQLRSKK